VAYGRTPSSRGLGPAGSGPAGFRLSRRGRGPVTKEPGRRPAGVPGGRPPGL